MEKRMKPFGTDAVAKVVSVTLTNYAPKFNELGLCVSVNIETEYNVARFYWNVFVNIHGWDITEGKIVDFSTHIDVGMFPDEECEPEETVSQIEDWLFGKLLRFTSGHEYMTHRPTERK